MVISTTFGDFDHPCADRVNPQRAIKARASAVAHEPVADRVAPMWEAAFSHRVTKGSHPMGQHRRYRCELPFESAPPVALRRRSRKSARSGASCMASRYSSLAFCFSPSSV